MTARLSRVPAVELRNVARVYPNGNASITILDGVNLMIAVGELVAITGPSGSGKTTLLNLMAGLDDPTEGDILLFGNSLIAMTDADRTALRAKSVGLVFQEAHLLPGLTALENVVAARLPWSRWQIIFPAARELLSAVGLEARMDFPPERLSAGERQRVGIARALVGRPQLLLADEPSGNLDQRATEEVLSLLERLRLDYDLTMVIATHDVAVAAVAERVIRVAGGHVVEDRALEQKPFYDVNQLEE